MYLICHCIHLLAASLPAAKLRFSKTYKAYYMDPDRMHIVDCFYPIITQAYRFHTYPVWAECLDASRYTLLLPHLEERLELCRFSRLVYFVDGCVSCVTLQLNELL